MALGDVLRLALIGRVSDTQWVNVHHYRVSNQTGTPAEECAALAQAFADQMSTKFAALQHQGVVADLISVRSVSNPGYGADEPITWQGSRAGDLLPFQVSAEVIWRTARFGRKFRGRTFLPPCIESDQQNGGLNSTYLSLADSYANEAITVTQTIDPTWEFEMVVYSRVNFQGEPVTSCQVVQILRTQRRRTPGFGS